MAQHRLAHVAVRAPRENRLHPPDMIAFPGLFSQIGSDQIGFVFRGVQLERFVTRPFRLAEQPHEPIGGRQAEAVLRVGRFPLDGPPVKFSRTLMLVQANIKARDHRQLLGGAIEIGFGASEDFRCPALPVRPDMAQGQVQPAPDIAVVQFERPFGEADGFRKVPGENGDLAEYLQHPTVMAILPGQLVDTCQDPRRFS